MDFKTMPYSIFYKNNIGVASKDKSNVYILYSDFNNNKTQLSAYKKNWQYGGGGSAKIRFFEKHPIKAYGWSNL